METDTFIKLFCINEKKTRANIVAKQRVGLPFMSKEKLEVSVRNRVLTPITGVTKTKRYLNRIVPGTT